MLTGLDWLALEAKYLEVAGTFYEETFGLTCRERGADELVFAAGDTDLVLRRPAALPRAGSTRTLRSRSPRPSTTTGGTASTTTTTSRRRALAPPDRSTCTIPMATASNSVNRTSRGRESTASSRSSSRSRISSARRPSTRISDSKRSTRATTESASDSTGRWPSSSGEPHLGIADARGGVHVDLGFETDEPAAALEAVRNRIGSLERESNENVVVRDPDGHFLTFTVA